ncbi:unnamed protein product [Spirodela intermedia]|uniref:Exostosin GT47 domain-containing protein n=1 Tax=Spirodela intermedia TaxID=51605 RepID=A0A7I8JVW6_SPIIN|nr:unnamed protein product [Spirodela intermedia]CAA6673602.1 unnamed protein product [Spirodela intermedia]
MLPWSDSPPPDPVKKPSLFSPAKDNHPEFLQQLYQRGGGGGGGGPSAAFHGIHACVSGRPRILLVFVILSLQLLLILFARSISVSSLVPPLRSGRIGADGAPLNFSASDFAPLSSSVAADGIPLEIAATCEYGRVYVYDLPPVFNKGLLDNCGELSPLGSRCDALSNGGFGQPSIDLAGFVPDALLRSWYATDQFAAEIIYHRRLVSNRCSTDDPSAASAFYIPSTAAWPWGNTSGPDRHSQMMLRWIRGQAPWRRSRGWDHFIVLGRISWDFRRSGEDGWGGSFLYMPEMENVTRLLIERNPWDYFDVGVPYPTGFHPMTPADVTAWQAFVLSRRRETLFSFAGGNRSRIKGDFRGVLLEHCARAPAGMCRSVDCSGWRCSNRTAETLNLFLGSVFCLQPRGDSFTRRSTFDCMVAGAIPVFFWRRSAYMQYEWFLPPTATSTPVDIGSALAGLGEERVRKMRQRVVELLPRLVYAQPGGGLGPAWTTPSTSP